MFTEEIIPYDANYNEKIKELVLKYISDYKNNYLSATTLIEVAFRFYDNDPEFNSVFPMFKGFWSFCMYMWMFAIDVYVWEKFYISYKSIHLLISIMKLIGEVLM